MHIKTLAFIIILTTHSFLALAQANDNEKFNYACDTQKFGYYNSTNLIDTFFFNLDCLKASYSKLTRNKNFHYPIETKNDSIRILLSCLTHLNCQIGVNPDRLVLYNETKMKLDSLRQSSIVEDELPNMLSTYEQFKIVESDLIIIGEVIQCNHDYQVPGISFRVFGKN